MTSGVPCRASSFRSPILSQVNPTPTPSPLLIEVVSESQWWDAPVVAVLAGLLAAVLGGLISIWATSRSESAQDRRTARVEAFAGFESISRAHDIIKPVAAWTNDGDFRHGEQVAQLIDQHQAEVRSAARRIRVHDRALARAVNSYTKSFDALNDAFTGASGKYASSVAAWDGSYTELERAVSRRVGTR